MNDPEGVDFIRGVRDMLRAKRLAEGRSLPRRTGKMRRDEDAADTADAADRFLREQETP
jgi:hypothetical protein